MTIQYVLMENNLTSDPTDYHARVRPIGTADLDAVVERVMNQGSTVTRADLYSVLEDYFSAIEEMVLEGRNVNTPLANYGASIKGVFDGPDDSYDDQRHQLRPTVNAGARLRNTVRARGRPEKQEAVKARPNPVEYVDLNSDEHNSILTPGGMGRLVGHRLKFDPDDSSQGIFLIAEDGAETRVAIVGRNKPSELMFMVPETLPAGDYTLDVRASVYDSQDVRAGALDAPLTVT